MLNGAKPVCLPASLGHACKLAPQLRDIDRLEIRAATGMSPEIALRMALARPHRRTVTVSVNREPVAMGGIDAGVGPRDGIVWLVGTDWLDKHPSAVMRLARKWLEIFDRDYDNLWNYVHNSNGRAKRWLDVLGFTVKEPQPYGVTDELFCYFSRSVR